MASLTRPLAKCDLNVPLNEALDALGLLHPELLAALVDTLGIESLNDLEVLEVRV
jgi:hypothetical protein